MADELRRAAQAALDWLEAAEPTGWTKPADDLRAALAARTQPLWTALVEDVWRDDDDRVVAKLRRTDDGNGTLPTGRSVEVYAAVAGSATSTTENDQ